ncbi:MAG TPA: hypothetical protein VN723_09130 [Rhizomicrobium sp.]|jgi:hypothetical protein|nr:hypothetical protein [Rhizomicrobium sp.]
MTTKTYLRGLLPWLLLGPVTGPLAEGIVRNWRARQMALAWLYGLALVVTDYDLYSAGGRAVIMLSRLYALMV